jgi:hypothetical protein
MVRSPQAQPKQQAVSLAQLKQAIVLHKPSEMDQPVDDKDEVSCYKWLGIREHQGVPTMFVSAEANERIFMPMDEKTCNLISIFGAARQGKSFLMNLLAGREDLFKISNSREPCTQGVDISSHLMPLDNFAALDGGSGVKSNNATVGFVDAEGQGDRDVTYDSRLVSPVLLSSKCVIFNWKDTLQKDRILNLLAVITMAAAGINQESSGSSADEKVFAHLHIVFRDWNFIEGDEQQVYADLFTPERESVLGGSEATFRNKARDDLVAAFKSIRIWLFPAPVADNKGLSEKIRFSSLQAPFKRKLVDFRGALAEQLREPMHFDGKPLTGRGMGMMVPALVEVLNKGQMILPKPIYASMMQSKADDKQRKLVDQFNSKVHELKETLKRKKGVVSSSAVEQQVAKLAKATLEEYDDILQGLPEQVLEKGRKDLRKHVRRVSEDLVDYMTQFSRNRGHDETERARALFDEEFTMYMGLEDQLPIHPEDLLDRYSSVLEAAEEIITTAFDDGSDQREHALRDLRAHATVALEQIQRRNEVILQERRLQNMALPQRRGAIRFLAHQNMGFNEDESDVGARLLFIISQRKLKPAADPSKVVGRLLNTLSLIDLQRCTEDEDGLTQALEEVGITSVHPCKHQGDGCDWHGAHFETHELECPFRFITCQNAGCGLRVRAKAYDKHLAQECQLRHTACEQCGVPLVFEELERHYQEECPKAEVDCVHACGLVLLRESRREHEENVCPQRVIHCEHCAKPLPAHALEAHIGPAGDCLLVPRGCPNNCGMELERSQWEAHIDPVNGTCLLGIVACPFQAYGCDFECRRKDRELHERDSKAMGTHLRIVLGTVQEQELILVQQQGSIGRLLSMVGKQQKGQTGGVPSIAAAAAPLAEAPKMSKKEELAAQAKVELDAAATAERVRQQVEQQVKEQVAKQVREHRTRMAGEIGDAVQAAVAEGLRHMQQQMQQQMQMQLEAAAAKAQTASQVSETLSPKKGRARAVAPVAATFDAGSENSGSSGAVTSEEQMIRWRELEDEAQRNAAAIEEDARQRMAQMEEESRHRLLAQSREVASQVVLAQQRIQQFEIDSRRSVPSSSPYDARENALPPPGPPPSLPPPGPPPMLAAHPGTRAHAHQVMMAVNGAMQDLGLEGAAAAEQVQQEYDHREREYDGPLPMGRKLKTSPFTLSPNTASANSNSNAADGRHNWHQQEHQQAISQYSHANVDRRGQQGAQQENQLALTAPQSPEWLRHAVHEEIKNATSRAQIIRQGDSRVHTHHDSHHGRQEGLPPGAPPPPPGPINFGKMARTQAANSRSPSRLPQRVSQQPPNYAQKQVPARQRQQRGPGGKGKGQNEEDCVVS